jgi:hypothetical protein
VGRGDQAAAEEIDQGSEMGRGFGCAGIGFVDEAEEVINGPTRAPGVYARPSRSLGTTEPQKGQVVCVYWTACTSRVTMLLLTPSSRAI